MVVVVVVVVECWGDGTDESKRGRQPTRTEPPLPSCCCSFSALLPTDGLLVECG